MRKQQSKTIQGRLKEDIDSTIDALEASIRGSGDAMEEPYNSERKKTRDPRERVAADYAGHAQKQRIVWISVGFITLTIFGMWGWNMRTVFYDAANGKYAVETPLNTVGEHFAKAMQIAGAQDTQAAESASLRDTAAALQHIETETTNTGTQTPPSTLDTLANILSTHVSSTPTSTANTTTTP
ncbi:MAG: hypothetical protein UW10_C0020G0006 [Candidatus Magasanikbacteria bacterium GW2011_GWA2_43_9]|nr:MAG: hypothetical protein UW10_C0020G0006 [Candidatus Magasanikbacteria bacterium GW2011_GWA2_43_9]